MPSLIKTCSKICEHCEKLFTRGVSPSGRLEGIADWNVRKFCSRACYVAWHVGENHQAFLPEGSTRKDGDVRVSRAGKRVYLHREIAGAAPGQEVHHKDESPKNNSPENLVLLSGHAEHLSKYHSDHLRALAAAQKGIPISDAHREAISRGSRGKKKSPEHAAKIKAALVAFHEARRGEKP